MGTDIYRFIVKSKLENDPLSSAYLTDTIALGLNQLTRLIYHELYFVEGQLSDNECSTLASSLLSDPLTQEVAYSKIELPNHQSQFHNLSPDHLIVEVAYHPGVTDPVADQIVRAAHVLGLKGVTRAATGHRFSLYGQQLSEEYAHQLATRLLSNSTIQWYSIGEIFPVFPHAGESSEDVEFFRIRDLSEGQLIALSQERRAALDLEEMKAIQDYYCAEKRDITDLEFETIAQTWSEHCVHKTFKANITITNPDDSDSDLWKHQLSIDNLLNTYLRSATRQINPAWLRSAFVDNAGIIDFDAENEISFKVETHNHPSAIEPFGGANTGTGGVIRDVIGVSAKPIAATDVLCFGPIHQSLEDLPAGVLHPLRIRSGVIAGVQDYGNKIGIPTVSGAILYDPGYTANPLVFCGCVGIAPKDSHPRSPLPGDRVIILGGRTGRDGLRGATFSSMTMDAQTGEVSGASVQIGAPIIEKGLIDVVILARDQKLYHAITDCGAGGLSSAVGEMASISGGDVDLKDVRLKYSGLAPWEIWLSEAQERMILAVPPTTLPTLLEICHLYDVELTDIGSFTDTGRLVVRYGNKILLNLENSFLHEGIPQRNLTAVLPIIPPSCAPSRIVGLNYAKTLKSLLSHPNIASKESVIRIYDHEVQGGTVVKPLTGAEDDGPSDAAVLKPIGTAGSTAFVLGAGVNPEYGKHNPYRMAISTIDEAIRNVVCVGGDPDRIALLDNFCWGDPKKPATLGTLVEACRGCHDASVYYRTPFISGKDSLNNEYLGSDGERHAIPPTLLISSISVIPDLYQTVTMDLKETGSAIYMLGDFQPRFQGSHFAQFSEIKYFDGIPGLPEKSLDIYRKLYQAIGAGFVNSCHDLSEGGLLVAAAEMCIGGRLGMDLTIDSTDPALACFGETNGSILVEVPGLYAGEFEKLFSELPIQKLGVVSHSPSLTVIHQSETILKMALTDLILSWKFGN
jgi:phosphoribosylformylglycinamidine synthase II